MLTFGYGDPFWQFGYGASTRCATSCAGTTLTDPSASSQTSTAISDESRGNDALDESRTAFPSWATRQDWPRESGRECDAQPPSTSEALEAEEAGCQEISTGLPDALTTTRFTVWPLIHDCTRTSASSTATATISAARRLLMRRALPGRRGASNVERRDLDGLDARRVGRWARPIAPAALVVVSGGQATRPLTSRSPAACWISPGGFDMGDSPMRKGSLRRGMIGGGVISVFSAATLASRSADPLPTFAYVLAFALLCVALALVLVVALNRPPKPSIRS